jgi:carbon-monoxide dehydrogenase medium subunit
MIPAQFDYVRAESVEHAIALLREHGADAKLLAGGQSLLPLMKLRFATPGLLVDLGRLSDLSTIRDPGAEVEIGALATHRDVATSSLVRRVTPLLADAASHVGDPQVRARGTIGGSLCHADPAGDLGATLLAYEARLVVRGPLGDRIIPLTEFFTGYLETALARDEIVLQVLVPKVGNSVGWAFVKLTRRAIDWATVGVAVLRGGGLARVALMNMASTPFRARAVEELLAQGEPDTQAAEAASEGASPPSDVRATASYRLRVARVLTRRALAEAIGRSSARRP